MHELGIMYHVVAQIKKIMEQNRLTKIEKIILQVGVMSEVVPGYLEACYPAAVDGTIMEEAKLIIEIMPANAICQDCGKVYDFIENKEGCPDCGSKRCNVLSGRELNIKEIVAC